MPLWQFADNFAATEPLKGGQSGIFKLAQHLLILLLEAELNRGPAVIDPSTIVPPKQRNRKPCPRLRFLFCLTCSLVGVTYSGTQICPRSAACTVLRIRIATSTVVTVSSTPLSKL